MSLPVLEVLPVVRLGCASSSPLMGLGKVPVNQEEGFLV